MARVFSLTGRIDAAAARLALAGVVAASLVLCAIDWLLFTVKVYDGPDLDGVASSLPICKIGSFVVLAASLSALWRRSRDADRGGVLVLLGALVGGALWIALALDLFGVARPGGIDLARPDALARPILIHLSFALAVAVPVAPWVVAGSLLAAPSKEVTP